MSCYTVPIVSFNDCLPLINLSEIQNIYVANVDAAPFTDWHSIAEWNTRINNTGAGINDIRKLTVIADMPLPNASLKTISGNRSAEIKTARQLNFDIDESTSENYDFAKSTETILGAKVKVWFKTASGVRWGGNNGITGILKIRPILARGADSIELYTGTFVWENIQSPDRYYDGSSAGEVANESGGEECCVNKKERIAFTNELNMIVDLTSSREANFGQEPVFEVWVYRPGSTTVADLVTTSVYVDSSGPTKQFIFYLPGTPGYITIA